MIPNEENTRNNFVQIGLGELLEQKYKILVIFI
jgi:hypothetical protein